VGTRESDKEEVMAYEPVVPVETVDDGVVTSAWSPAQIIGLIAGIGMTVLGIAAVARTGFHTDHIYSPHALVWHLPHSPLLGVIEIGFGVLLILASVVPGAARGLMGLLGAIALAFGIVVLVNTSSDNLNLNHTLAVTHRSGWFFVIVGAVVLLAALFSPVFIPRARRRRHLHDRSVVA
jgi:hypothetical protein